MRTHSGASVMVSLGQKYESGEPPGRRGKMFCALHASDRGAGLPPGPSKSESSWLALPARRDGGRPAAKGARQHQSSSSRQSRPAPTNPTQLLTVISRFSLLTVISRFSLLTVISRFSQRLTIPTGQTWQRTSRRAASRAACTALRVPGRSFLRPAAQSLGSRCEAECQSRARWHRLRCERRRPGRLPWSCGPGPAAGALPRRTERSELVQPRPAPGR